MTSPGDRKGAGARPRRSLLQAPAPHGSVVALAAVAGALGGALATAGLGHLGGNEAAAVRNVGLETSVARLDADILALKASVEQNSRMATGQINKTSDRLDKVERAQTEPAAKLAKLSDAVEKLRNAQATALAAAAPAAPVATAHAAAAPAAAAPAAPKENIKEVTGSVTPSATAAAAAPAARPQLAKPGLPLPTVEGWVLRDVGHGGALIEGRRGIFEIYAGDSIPGVGRVDAIRKQDGRWVVVTSKGLIVAR